MLASASTALTAAAFIAGCSASQPVRVLPADETMLTMSVGGPVAPGSSPIGFIPYTVIGIAHGASTHLTVHGNVHAVMAAFGVLALDVGASWQAWRQQDALPELTLAARGIVFSDFRSLDNMRVYPDASFVASWDVHDGLLAYGGTHVTLQPTRSRVFLSPMAGVLMPISDKWGIQLEAIWQASNVRTTSGVFEGESTIGTTGSLGVFIGGQIRL